MIFDGKKNIGVVRVRGLTKIRETVSDTMSMLCLYRKNCCVIVKNTPSIGGMLNKAKDFITWGEIDDETLKLMVEKRGKECKDKESAIKKKCFEYNGKKYRKYFRLAPPKGGFERGGIKTTFIRGGVLGYRAEKINSLIRKML